MPTAQMKVDFDLLSTRDCLTLSEKLWFRQFEPSKSALHRTSICQRWYILRKLVMQHICQIMLPISLLAKEGTHGGVSGPKIAIGDRHT